MKYTAYTAIMTVLGLALILASGTIAFAQEAGVAAESTFGLYDWAAMFGRFHPIVLHFPIGLLVAAFLLEMLGVFRTFQNHEPANWLLLLLGTGSAIIAAVFGVFLSWEGGYDETNVFWHQWTGIGVAALASIAVIVRFIHSRTWKNSFRKVYRVLLFAVVILITVAGHYGGNLTHGSTYLFENMPPWMPLANLDEGASPAANIAGSEYAEIIQPILEGKCYECHGESKNKGDYKMLTREEMLTPGESELAPIVPGKATESNLVRLIALPAEHEDVMPPEGKGAITGDELIAIMRWIDRGADFGDGANTIVVAKEKAKVAEIDSSILDSVDPIDFEKHIWPIIEASCLKCHDEEEQEGDLRLDTKAFILEGGEFGEVLVPGDPEGSTFYELITLPADDPDVMPAKADPLPDIQIAIIKRWIEEGCDFGDWTGE